MSSRYSVDEGRLFKEIAPKIFPPDSWTDHEVKLLKKLGLLSWFGLWPTLEPAEDEFDFFEDFPFRTKSKRDDWL